MMNIIELDFCADYSFKELYDDIKDYGLEAQIIELCGRGGGNPFISLKGNREDIIGYLENVNCVNIMGEIEYYKSRIKEV